MQVVTRYLHIIISHQLLSRINPMASTSLVNPAKSVKLGAIYRFSNKNHRSLMAFSRLLPSFGAILAEIWQQNRSLVNSEQLTLPEALLNIRTLTRR